MIEDEAYVRELLAILTNPHPTGISPDDPYRQADDGIDRYGGFGRDYWVEALRPVDDGPSAELQVSYGVAVPDDPSCRDVPDRGTMRVPFGREWRHLSRYAEPAAYAPRIAASLGPEVGRLVERNRLPRREPTDLAAVRARLPTQDEVWDELVTFLGGLGSARQVADGRLKVSIEDEAGGTPDRITVLVTPEQWTNFVARHDDWQMRLDEVLGPRKDDELFLLFMGVGFARSIREELPPVHGGIEKERRSADLRASGAELRWVLTDRNGNTIYELGPPP